MEEVTTAGINNTSTKLIPDWLFPEMNEGTFCDLSNVRRCKAKLIMTEEDRVHEIIAHITEIIHA